MVLVDHPDMVDIVARLRRMGNAACNEAADEIENDRAMYAKWCVQVVSLGAPEFGTLSEGINRLAENVRRKALEEAAALLDDEVAMLRRNDPTKLMCSERGALVTMAAAIRSMRKGSNG